MQVPEVVTDMTTLRRIQMILSYILPKKQHNVDIRLNPFSIIKQVEFKMKKLNPQSRIRRDIREGNAVADFMAKEGARGSHGLLVLNQPLRRCCRFWLKTTVTPRS